MPIPIYTYTWTIPSSFEALEEIVEELSALLESLGIDEELIMRVVVATSEAITNAIVHGNKLMDNQQVYIKVTISEQYIEVTVEDEGEGFDRTLIPDPLLENALLNPSGRGIFLIEELANKVYYENGGRRVVMHFERT